MKFVFFPVSENGENGLSDEGAADGGNALPQNFLARTGPDDSYPGGQLRGWSVAGHSTVVLSRVELNDGILVRHFPSPGTGGWSESSSSDGRRPRPNPRARITAITSTATTYARKIKLISPLKHTWVSVRFVRKQWGVTDWRAPSAVSLWGVGGWYPPSQPTSGSRGAS